MTFTGWRTPSALFEPLNLSVGGFAVDAAADEDNKLVDNYYGPGSALGEDALLVPEWLNPAWCNPPYGRGLPAWVKKFDEQANKGVSIVALLPAYVERKWWHELVIKAGADVIFLVGRVPFERAGMGEGEAAKSRPRDPSAIVIFGPTATGNTGWLDWKQRAKNAKVVSSGSSNNQGGSPD